MLYEIKSQLNTLWVMLENAHAKYKQLFTKLV